MALWRLYYHVVFATDERRAVLSPPLRAAATRLIAAQCAELRCVLHALHVQPDQVLLVVSIPPSLAIATVIGELKGASSHALGPQLPDAIGAGRTGYGVFSFGEKQLPVVVQYVREQDRHHAAGSLRPSQERTAPRGEDHGPLFLSGSIATHRAVCRRR